MYGKKENMIIYSKRKQGRMYAHGRGLQRKNRIKRRKKMMNK
jgi:hypothetical protein